jgi:hypothetical protein
MFQTYVQTIIVDQHPVFPVSFVFALRVGAFPLLVCRTIFIIVESRLLVTVVGVGVFLQFLECVEFTSCALAEEALEHFLVAE